MNEEFDVELWWKQTRRVAIMLMPNPALMLVIGFLLRYLVDDIRAGGLWPQMPLAVQIVCYAFVLLIIVFSLLRRRKSIRYFLSKPLELEQILGLYRGLMIRNIVLSHTLATVGVVLFLLRSNLVIFIAAVVLSYLFSILHFPRKGDLGMEIL
jgi:hypothetical protein